jgi:hypothetical protein
MIHPDVKKYFGSSIIFAFFAYAFVFFQTLLFTSNPPLTAFIDVFVLSLTEIAMSVDNAVVNAEILKNMSEKWQHRFITWGMFFALFVVRFFIPIMIVSLADGIGIFAATKVAFTEPEHFKHIMQECNDRIMAFGSMFLLLTTMNYFLNSAKETHWLPFEQYFAKFEDKARYSIMALTAICIIVGLFFHDTAVATAAGWGFLVYEALLLFKEKVGGADITVAVAKNGMLGLIYLEVLDASFSVDGVVASFALTSAFMIITLGLSVGAMFVRSTTIYLVKKDSLKEFKYLEPAAYLSISFLVLTMFLSIAKIELGEVLIGCTSLGIIAAGIISSMKLTEPKTA